MRTYRSAIFDYILHNPSNETKSVYRPKILLGHSDALTFDDVNLKPRYSEIESRSKVDLSTKFTKNRWIDIPLIASPMDTVCELEMAKIMWELGGVGILHRFCTIEQQCQWASELMVYIRNDNSFETTYKTENPILCAAIGSNGDAMERAEKLINSGVNVLLVDVAHGHHISVKRIISELKNTWLDIDVIAGNIATAEAAYDLTQWGADGIRANVGGGSACSTRLATGIGVPNLTSLDDVTSGTHLPVISDGGIRRGADIVKSLCAGASSVMCGSLFAATDEAPGRVEHRNGQNYKLYRGSASSSIKQEKNGSSDYVEGESTLIPCKGSVKTIVKTLMEGVASGASYLGHEKITDLWKDAEFVRVTTAGVKEAQPHILL